MEKTKALKQFINDEQILECLILFESRKMDACRLLSSYLFDKWRITTLQAFDILMNIQKEFQK